MIGLILSNIVSLMQCVRAKIVDDSSHLMAPPHTQAQMKAIKLSSDLLAQLDKDILEERLIINEEQVENEQTQKPLALRMRKKALGDDEASKGGQRMQDGEEQEDQKNASHRSGGLHERRFISKITKEDSQKIKAMLEYHRKFEEQLHQKSITYEQNLKKFRNEEAGLLERLRKQSNEERLKQVNKHIQQMREKQQRRKALHEQQQRQYEEMKNHKRLYERMNQQWKINELQEEKEKEIAKANLKNRSAVDFALIRQHQQRHDQLMQQQRAERERKMGELTKSSSKKYQLSKFYANTVDEDEKNKQILEEKKHIVKEFVEKKIEYSEMVRKNYLPSSQATDDNFEKNSQMPKSKSLSSLEQHKRGNEYMKMAQQVLSREPKKVSLEEEPFKYKNYLQQLRKTGQKGSNKGRYLEQIENIMLQKSMTQEEKFYKAKKVADNLEKGKSSNHMIEVITAKIHLLRRIVEE